MKSHMFPGPKDSPYLQHSEVATQTAVEVMMQCLGRKPLISLSTCSFAADCCCWVLLANGFRQTSHLGRGLNSLQSVQDLSCPLKAYDTPAGGEQTYSCVLKEGQVYASERLATYK